MPRKAKHKKSTTRTYNYKRSRNARNADKGKRAKNTLKNTPRNRSIWKLDPGHYDLEGVDAPRRRKKKKKR